MKQKVHRKSLVSPTFSVVGCIHTVPSGIELSIIRCFIVSQLLMLALTTEPVTSQYCPSFPPAGIYLVSCDHPSVNATPRCIQEEWVCDGYKDCAGGQDESPATCNDENPCANNACQNGATCVGFSRQDRKSVAYYVCHCAPGFIGRYCEVISYADVTSTAPFNKDEAVVTFQVTAAAPALTNSTTTATTFTSTTTTSTTSIATTTTTMPTETESTYQPLSINITTVAVSDTTEQVTIFPDDVTGAIEINKRVAEPTSLPQPNVTSPIQPRATMVPDIAACFPNPCLNGVCTPLWSGFHCNCRPGYGGTRCEKGINACASRPCINGGSCFRTGDTYRCSCLPGFTGRQCDVEINECLSNPCKNGATCDNQINGYTCVCKEGFTGLECEININECASDPCHYADGGVCIDGINGYTCQCPPSRAGKYCERPQLCTQDPCMNYGICNVSPVPGAPPTCYCLPGFTGQRCETNLNECLSNPCVQGRCFDGDNKYVCMCNNGYTGTNCETLIDPCEPNPCRNNGYCCRSGKTWCARQLPIWYFECYCPNGFTGKLCERQLDPCYSNPCLNNGICSPDGEGYVCTCPVNYNGQRCEISAPCSSAPCLFGGTCVDEGAGSYRCQCDSQHFGQYCESLYSCLSNPCQNGGSCINHDNGYSCSCPDNYIGINCEIYQPCMQGVCRNGATCVPVLGGLFSCLCTSNFTGQFCEQYLPCTGQPCLNGGQCVDTDGRYSCVCPFDYTGQNCESFLPCASVPCKNGGSCLVSGNTFLCQCVTGYTGPTCEIPVPCASLPCINGGTCNDVGGGRYTCTCPATHTGSQCEIPVPCVSNPCLNSGLCIADGLRYRCQCTPAYTGPRCETYLSCLRKPCLNGGTCYDLPNEQFQCTCPPGYTGQICETPMLCFPNPCLNNGRCSVVNSQIQCSCTTPFFGPRCEQRDFCATQPCQNQGYCIKLEDGFKCICPTAYTGTLCETYLHCSSNPCLNNAVCIEAGSTYRCNCTQMYGGENCEVYLPCGSHPCLNGADCIGRGQNYQCVCLPNYIGTNCETPLPCASSPCFGGICNNIGDTYVCHCDRRYTGRNCDVPIICDQSTCINGQCQLVDGVGTCVCNPGFTGPNCETNISPCLSNPCAPLCTCIVLSVGGYKCQCPSSTTTRPPVSLSCETTPCFNGGQCIKTDNGYVCQCIPPFTGVMCEKRSGICDSKPCLNGGRCIPDGIAYTCICQPPWTGDICQREIVSCEEAPCKNGGTCFLDSLGVYCMCPDPYEGLFCQLQKGICDPNPCQNGGVCWQLAGSLGCDCPRGYEGTYCEVKVIGCNPNPCNEGNCLENSQGKFQCSCPPEWTGDQCQIRNPCYSQPCKNGGTCAATDSGFQCFCVRGYTGLTCDGALPACNSVPCFNGATCHESATMGYVCDCLPGYTGRQCEINIDECQIGSPRCANGGTCIDEVNGFRCVCPAGFTGSTCTTRDSCINQPCGTTGTCISTPNVQFGLDYTCLCQPQYSGPNCKQFNYCSSSPCTNGGTCTNEPNGFRCTCLNNFTGVKCENQVLGCTGVTCNGHGTCVPQGLFGYICNCTEGYVGKDCETPSCNINPCQNGGTCISGGPRGYICQCPGPYAGQQCQQNLSQLWPRYSGNSYLVLPMASGLATNSEIEMRFYPTSGYGLLMYASQAGTVTGDFIALGLDQNRPIFRINLGAGVLTLTGPSVAVNEWYTVKVTRIERRTWLSINSVTVYGEAPEGSIGLTLENYVWIGGVANNSVLNPRVLFQTGFQGCIHDFRIGQSRAALIPITRAISSQDLSQCSADPCTTSRCMNDGQCLYQSDSSYSCLCPIGFTSKDCSTRVLLPVTPLFEEKGYLVQNLPAGQFSGQTFVISVEIRPTNLNGTVLYAAEANDFLALFLHNGNVLFSFDFGSGSATLTSISKVVQNDWQSVSISRSGQRVQLLFRSDPAVVETAHGSNTGLDVGGNLYVGGIPDTIELRKEVLNDAGFTGCIRNIAIQETTIDLSRVTQGYGVSDCIVPPCDGNRCSSGSTCKPDPTSMLGYKCDCPPGKTGAFCEASQCVTGSECNNGGVCALNAQGLLQCRCTHLWTGPTCSEPLRFTIASFAGDGYLAFPNDKFIGFEFTEFEIVFRTTMTDGLILWMGNASSEFLALGIRNGYVQVSVNIAGQPGQVGQITLNLYNVSNNQWVTVNVEMSKQFIFVQVTNNEGRTTSQYGEIPGSDTQFDVGDDPVYLGGLPGDIAIQTDDLYTRGLVGCVLQFRAAKVMRQLREILLQQDAIDGSDVSSCVIT